MAVKLVAGASQCFFFPFDTERLEELRTSVARYLFQVTTQSRAPLVIGKISDRRSCGNHAKPRVEGSELAQKCLEGRLTQPSFLWTGRILERLQTIQQQ